MDFLKESPKRYPWPRERTIAEKQAGFQPSGRQGIPAYVVEVRYGATEGAADRRQRAHESTTDMPEVRRISTESQRRERAVEIFAEAVYSYLRKRGQLSARAGYAAGIARGDGPGSGGKILDERLDFQAQPTGTYDGVENAKFLQEKGL